MGHSLGGMTALAYLGRPACDRPVEPKGLVLVATAAGRLAERGWGGCSPHLPSTLPMVWCAGHQRAAMGLFGLLPGRSGGSWHGAGTARRHGEGGAGRGCRRGDQRYTASHQGWFSAVFAWLRPVFDPGGHHREVHRRRW
ncbi:putative alpha/beta hydrolase [Mycobacterium xenopi 3993]|nr:putative alpha/beta hydrolase [Mycobacterium xenopi 3993]